MTANKLLTSGTRTTSIWFALLPALALLGGCSTDASGVVAPDAFTVRASR